MAGKIEHQANALDFELILTGMNEALDLSLVVVEINLFEDMFGPFMRMEVVVNDSMGLFDKYPLIGEETLTFKRKNPNDFEYTHEFKVYAVSERTLVNSRAHGIVIHAISPEGLKNSMEYVYKPWQNEKCHTIVEDIYFDYLEESFKSITVDPSVNEYTKVATGVNPLKLINEIAGEAKSVKFSTNPNGPSSYVFFENANQFYFVPIPYFFAADPAYTFELGVPMEQEQFEPGDPTLSKNVQAMRFVSNFDNMDVSHYGAYLNEVNSVDPILKRFKMHPIQEKEKYTFKYLRDFDKLKHLPNSEKKYLLGNDPLSPASAKKLYSTHRRMLHTQIEEDGENYPSIAYLDGRVSGADQLNAPRKRHQFLSATLHEKANLQTHNLEITVAGVVELYVGMLVVVKVPQPTQTRGDFDKFLYLYGQEATFLVTALRHVYHRANDSYHTVLSLSKESFGEEPQAREFDNSPEDSF